jgi:DNA primase catalytic subunit
MLMADTKYRVFHKSVKGTRKLYPLDSFLDMAISTIDKDPSSDYYESIYVYEKKHKEQLEQTKSLSGIKDVRIDRLVFDFDSKELEKALTDARVLVSRLAEEFNPEAIRVFFSGSKGMHVEIHLEQFLTREKFETIIDFYAGDLETFDTKIKDEQRLFRFPLTKHNKTGLFKIPLSIDQLNSMDINSIKELAKEIKPEFYDLMNAYSTSSINSDKYQAQKKENKSVNSVLSQKKEYPDLSRRPKYLTAAKYVLQQGFFDNLTLYDGHFYKSKS